MNKPMKIKISYGDSVCAVPARALSEHDAERTDLFVLMYLCADPGAAEDIPALAKRIGCTQKKVLSSIAFWREAGIITDAGGTHGQSQAEATGDEAKAGGEKRSKDALTAETDGAVPRAAKSRTAAETAGSTGGAEQIMPPSPAGEGGASRFESRPQYSGEELAALTEARGGELRKLIDTCQGIVGRIFTQTEAAKVVGLYEYLGLDVEHILSLFTYCAHRGKRAVGYVEKTAYNLYDEGIDSAAKLEEYIKKKEEKEREEAHMRALFGLGERALTAKERQAYSLWLHEWKLPEEVIVRAYEQTVENTGKYSLAYMSRVLESWYMAGLCTIDRLDEYEKKRQSTAGGAAKTGNTSKKEADSFDTDRFVELALARSYEALRRSKKGGAGGAGGGSGDSTDKDKKQ